MKVDVATAAVAKIANKTLKLLCMVSIGVTQKN